MALSDFFRRGYLFCSSLSMRLTHKSVCPACSAQGGRLIGRKFYVFAVLECQECGLAYRLPSQPIAALYSRFYHGRSAWRDDYSSGELQRLAKIGFQGSRWDYLSKLSLIKEVVKAGRALDFGGGVGMITHQLASLGYDSHLVETWSEGRRIAGEVFGVPAYPSLEAYLNSEGQSSVNVLLLHHVLEHLSTFSHWFSLFERVLDKDGIIVIFVPNGDVQGMSDVIDSAHISAFKESTLRSTLQRFGFDCVAFSSPYGFDKSNADSYERTMKCRGNELACIAWRKGSSPPKAFQAEPYQLPDISKDPRVQAGC